MTQPNSASSRWPSDADGVVGAESLIAGRSISGDDFGSMRKIWVSCSRVYGRGRRIGQKQ